MCFAVTLLGTALQSTPVLAIAATTALFAMGWDAAGTAMSVGLLIPAGLVGFFDVCLPSMLFNAIVYRRLKPRQP